MGFPPMGAQRSPTEAESQMRADCKTTPHQQILPPSSNICFSCKSTGFYRCFPYDMLFSTYLTAWNHYSFSDYSVGVKQLLPGLCVVCRTGSSFCSLAFAACGVVVADVSSSLLFFVNSLPIGGGGCPPRAFALHVCAVLESLVCSSVGGRGLPWSGLCCHGLFLSGA